MDGLMRMVMTVVMAAGLAVGFTQPVQAAEHGGHDKAEALKPQATCPVMGGAINKALYADVEGKRVYVCCKGCIAKIEAEPTKYIAVLAERGEAVAAAPGAQGEKHQMKHEMHKEGMHEGHITANGEKCVACAKGECTGEQCKAKHGAEAAMTCEDGSCKAGGGAHAAATLQPQKTCPVMGGKINRAVYADVNGKRVYACCPGCIAKIKAEPDKYMAVLAERGEGVETLPVAKLNTETLATLRRVGVKMILLDARGTVESVIPGAVHLPSKAAAEKVAATLPDKDALIVTYCASLQCPASANLAGRLRELGYSNVVEYPYGVEGWTAAGLKTEPVAAD